MAGLGVLQAGARDRNARLIHTGLRAVTSATDKVDGWFPTRPFAVWAVASAYNLTEQRLGRYVSARRALRRWARWLRHQKTTFLHRGGYNNKYLVDALAVLEVQRTGLRSRVPRTILGSRRGSSRKRALGLMNRRIPAAVVTSQFVLSDPDTNPAAYHALSFALYARATRLLGRRASRRNRAVLRELARTTEQIAAPDGDLAYWGRSAQQKWTLSAAAYGLAVTAALPGVDPTVRMRYHALADRLLRRLGTYGVGSRGEWLTPSLKQEFTAGAKSLDTYARATEYTGLALVALNWAEQLLPLQASSRDALADGPNQSIVGQGVGRFATVRIGDLWYAVKEQAVGERGIGDLRYDFGLVAFKRLKAGSWSDVIPLRPLGSGSAGPVLLTAQGPAFPSGASMVTSGDDGGVLIRGGFRYSDGGWARTQADFTVRPSEDRRCVVTSVGALPGDRFEFSAFFRGEVTPAVRGRRVESGDQQVAFNLPIRLAAPERGYSSSSDARVTRQRVEVRSPVAQPVSMTTC